MKLVHITILLIGIAIIFIIVATIGNILEIIQTIAAIIVISWWILPAPSHIKTNNSNKETISC